MSANPFGLLRYVGEDCAGAAQFARPDRVAGLLAGEGGVEWVGEDDIAHRLRTLRRDPTAWHMATAGQFSLAGAQAKTALHYEPDSGRWGDPWGAVPTTHILKPAVVGFDEHDLNEHLCLETARTLGIASARSDVRAFGEERAIVIERYDRVRMEDGGIRRIHQEDMCQALGRLPTEKYQNEGGPTPEQIIELLRGNARPAQGAIEDIQRFVDALAFNWMIGGTDAHAKNYSILLASGLVRLAPLYDVASALPYDDMYLPKLRTAMRIDREYRLESISGRHWRRFAEANGLDPDEQLTRIENLVAQVVDALAEAVRSPAVHDLRSELPVRLLDRVGTRIQWCRQALSR